MTDYERAIDDRLDAISVKNAISHKQGELDELLKERAKLDKAILAKQASIGEMSSKLLEYME